MKPLNIYFYFCLLSFLTLTSCTGSKTQQDISNVKSSQSKDQSQPDSEPIVSPSEATSEEIKKELPFGLNNLIDTIKYKYIYTPLPGSNKVIYTKWPYDWNEDPNYIYVYDINSKTLDSAICFINDKVDSIIPSNNPNLVYVVTSGGSGCYCDVMEYQIGKMKECKKIIENISRTFHIKYTGKEFIFSRYREHSDEVFSTTFDTTGKKIMDEE